MLPLAGFSIGVTADRRADEQAELLRRRGAEVVHGPVIRTLALTDGPELEAATEALIDDPPEVLVALTGVGVRSWFEAADGRGRGDALRDRLARTTVLARGPKAAGALATVGLDAGWQAPGESSVEVLAHLSDDLTGRRIAVQRDGDDRAHLALALAERGADVVDVPVYRWELPLDRAPATSLVAAIVSGQLDAVTFTTAAAASNLFALAAEHGGPQLVAALTAALRGPVVPVCVGPMSAARLAGLGVADPLYPLRWRLGPMVRCVVDALAGRCRVIALGGDRAEVQGTMVSLAAGQVSLSRREAQVLTALVDAHGAVVPKERLARTVWEPGTDPHVVEVTVARLRRRLGPVGAALETVPRRGYRIPR
ncbi:uroporphyrinogen-III synthase [Iamia sp.]|uniref:uroporphyrinogen-III synthase n=1 Tax=Iamia sp. TaxID=2722710 RepID=UPI002D15C6A2|nr:uroporphyrinogen-III synthase [Iamia sp.]HXH55930.1 uroporphyrinogen-III synthase [Iamia sp.]